MTDKCVHCGIPFLKGKYVDLQHDLFKRYCKRCAVNQALPKFLEYIRTPTEIPEDDG